KAAPPGVVAPAVGAVGVDGGRMQIFERPPSATVVAAANPEPDVVVTTSAVLEVDAGPPGREPAATGPWPETGAATTVTRPELDVLVTAPPASGTGAGPPGAAVAAGPPGVVAAVDSPAPGEEDDDEERRGRFWREDKIGVLLTMTSAVSADDPC